MFSSDSPKRGFHKSPMPYRQPLQRRAPIGLSLPGWGCLCLLALMMAAVQVPLAQDDLENLIPKEPITAKVIVGVDPDYPYRRDLSWVPITVELTNNSKAVQGELIVQMKNGTVTYKTPVDLPSRTTKAFDLYVLFIGLQDELEFYIQTGRSRILIELVTISMSFPQSNRFAAVISSERGTHGLLAHRPEDEDTDRFRRVVYTTPAQLPDFSIGYQNFDVLLWDGGPTDALSPNQSAALEKWIQMGGTLVLAAGERWQELSDSPFRLFVPMTLSGSRVLEAETTLTSISSTIQPVLGSGTVIATGELLDDPNIHIRLSAGEDPFLIDRRWGAGRIVFLASSVSEKLLKNDINQIIFQDFITNGPIAFNPEVTEYLDTGVSSFLKIMVQKELPSTWFIAIYLGCYILIVVPINYLVFRAIGRLEWAWFTVPIWALIFAYGAYYIGALRQQGHVTVNQISIVEARPSASTGMATTFSSIYSPVRQWYTLHFEDPAAFPSLLASSQRGGNPSRDERLTINYTEQGSSVEDFLIYHWSDKLVKTQHEISLGEGVDIDLKWEDDQILGSITNRTGQTLYDSSIYSKDRIIHLQTVIEDGQTIDIDRDFSSATPFNSESIYYETANIRSPREFQRKPSLFIQNSLEKSYAATQLIKHHAMGIAVLAARLDRHALDFRLNKGIINPDGEMLLGLTFPLKKKIQGRLILSQQSWRFGQGDILAGFNPRMMGGNGRMPAAVRNRNQGNDAQIQVLHDTEKVWDIASDIPLEGGLIESLTFNLNYHRLQHNRWSGRSNNRPYSIVNEKPSDPKFELQVKNQFTSQFVPLSSIIDEEGEIINPGRYVDKLNGIITVQLFGSPNHDTFVAKNAFNIEMMINFGSETSGKFLDRMVDTVSERL